jgi:hypothetical protein
MDKKPDPIIRKSISLRESLWREVEEYQKREIGAATLAEAVRRLISDALRAAKRRAEK